MILFRLISWPYVRKHALRSLLTVAGIAIGIAVFVAMHAANDAVFRAFQQTVSRLAGATELQVTAGFAGFDEQVLERVQALPQVAVAAPVIEAVGATGLPGQGNLLILGVDMTGDRSLREYDLESGDAAVIDDPLVFLAQPDSVMVTAEFARRNGLDTNGRFPLDTVEGRKEFVVRGILGGGGLSSAFGGNIAIMDIYAVQHVFGRGRRFDRLDIALAPGVPIRDGQQALRAALGPGFEVQTPDARGQSFESLLRIYNLMLRFSSVYALVIGLFMIYNAFSTAVTQRRNEIGILRALGATRGQIARLFVGESALGGLVGSAIGVAAGYALAGGVARVIGRMLEGMQGVSQGAADVTPELWLVALALALGTLTSIVAASLPAWQAARVDPVKALQRGRVQVLGARENRVRTIAAVVLGVGGGAIFAGTRSLAAFYVGYLCVLLAALLLTPFLSVWLVRALRPVLGWLRPVEGLLAADSLIAAPRRTSATVSALMLALALAVGLGGVGRASYDSITGWANTALNPDFFVTGSPTLTGRDYRFPAEMTSTLEGVEGVGQVQQMRQTRVPYGDGLVLLMATDVARLAGTSRRVALEGDADDMYRRTAAGEAVIASENLASTYGLRVGDTIALPAPGGLLRLPIAGVVREYSDQQGSVMLDLSVYRAQWQDDTVDFFRVYLAPGAEPARVRERILERFAGERRLFVLSSHEVRAYVARLADQWFNMTWLQIAVAILVAVLGVVNSLTVTIADRRRELGVLQAVGGLRQQVRHAIWMEGATVAVVCVLLGLALGAVHLYFVLEISHRDYPGLRFDYTYPYGIALALFPVMVVAAVAASIGPAESAVRGSLVEALEYE
jgi:putative ABC transport system permease protein